MEIGLAKNWHGPFPTEAAAVRDARNNKAHAFVTGLTKEGWCWALEEDYIQLAGDKLKAVN